MLKWLSQWVCFSFLHIFSILSGSYDRLGSGARECILILRMRHPIVSNRRRPFWSMWRMNTVPNIDVCQLIQLNTYQGTIPSPPRWLQDSVSNSSGPSLRVQVRVGTEPEPDWRSGSSINPNCQFRYSSMDIPLPVWIGRVLSWFFSGSICKYI